VISDPGEWRLDLVEVTHVEELISLWPRRSTRRPKGSSARRSWSRSGIRVARAGILLAVLTSMDGRATEGGTRMEPEDVYWMTDMLHGSVYTAIMPTLGSVHVTGNYEGAQSIGYYERALARHVFERIKQMVDTVGLEKLPEYPPLPPDTRGTSVGKTLPDGQVVVRGYPLWDVPKQLQPVIDAFKAQTAELMKHPVRVIRGEGTPVKTNLSLADVLSFAITLTNAGTSPLKLDNPFHKRMEEGLTLQLHVKPDRPSEQIREGEELWIECVVDHVRAKDPKASLPGGRQVTLAPGAKLQFIVRKKLLLKPGSYRAELFYRTTRVKDDVSSMEGTLTIVLGTFEVLST
jgi:hypothetical protein